ncbi:putative Rho GDP-dissociation inhibitor [Operophtera brumata]|uniref:Putative Rho GDP-dissociation inhibitor n=1 Tax=Operophtera brumata TaxID=104452 RepID=A0A0L7LHE3_OPEBR|nr:putative Rho GDP-dissociation inhibitor [Operophtera brumata]
MSGDPEVHTPDETHEEEEIKSSYKPPPEKNAGDPRKVIVKKLALCVVGRDDVDLDLSGDLTDLKKQYRIRIDFIVQREIVHGLKYQQKTYRMGMPVDKMTHMVGSYPPKTEIQSYTTPPEDAPSGLMARGSYTVNSLFTDDDKNIHLQWEWSFEIKKDWKD